VSHDLSAFGVSLDNPVFRMVAMEFVDEESADLAIRI